MIVCVAPDLVSLQTSIWAGDVWETRDVSDWLSWRLPRFGQNTCAEHVWGCSSLLGFDVIRRVRFSTHNEKYLLRNENIVYKE